MLEIYKGILVFPRLENDSIKNSFDVFVSETGTMNNKEIIRSISIISYFNLIKYFNYIANKKSVNNEINNLIKDNLIDCLKGTEYFIDCNYFLKLCETCIDMLNYDSISEELNNFCYIISKFYYKCLTSVGLYALIDEATGYQKVRGDNCLREIFKLNIRNG